MNQNSNVNIGTRTNKPGGVHQNSDSERVFSYAYWEIIHGQTPLWTNQDRTKFKALDGKSVEKMDSPVIGISGQSYVCASPYGGPMFLGTHATRKKGEKDTPVETLFSDAEFIKSVQMGMAVEASSIPYDFCSLAYIDNIKTEQSWFALVRLSSSQLATKEYIVFDTVGKRVSACGKFRSFMLNKLKKYKAVIPNGYLKQESDCAVFWLSYDRIIECMQEYYPDLKFEFKTDPEQVAQKYFKLVGDPFAQRDVWKKQYEEVCKSILEEFSKQTKTESCDQKANHEPSFSKQPDFHQIGRNDPCPCDSRLKYKRCCYNKHQPKPSAEQLVQNFLNKTKTIKNERDELDAVSLAIAIGRVLSADEISIEFYSICATLFNFSYAHSFSMLAIEQLCLKEIANTPSNHIAISIKAVVAFAKKNFEEAEHYHLQSASVTQWMGLTASFSLVMQSMLLDPAVWTAEEKDTFEKFSERLLNNPSYHKTPEFDQYKAAVLAVTRMMRTVYFYFVQKDVVSAYSDCSDFVRMQKNISHVDSGMLQIMASICMDNKIQKYDEALTYIDKAIANAKTIGDKNLFLKTKGNIFELTKQYSLAKDIFGRLMKAAPSIPVAYSYAKVLYHSGNYEEAERQIKTVVEAMKIDVPSFVLLAQIYDKTNRVDQAVESYCKAISAYKSMPEVIRFTDPFTKKLMIVGIDRDAENYKAIQNAYIELINLLCHHNNLAKARKVLSDAKETLPDRHEWILAETSIAKAELAEVEQRRAESEKQRADTESQRADAEKHRAENLRKQVLQELEKKYPNLCEQALNAAVEAESRYKEQKTTAENYGAIARDFCVSFEIQLRESLSDRLPRENMTLGEIVYEINNKKISPLHRFSTDLRVITEIRNKSAHSGEATKADLELLRKLLFERDLLGAAVSIRKKAVNTNQTIPLSPM